ncbi:CDK5 and ABL1 enzyme substrate 1, partial [Rhizopus stolonifer]
FSVKKTNSNTIFTRYGTLLVGRNNDTIYVDTIVKDNDEDGRVPLSTKRPTYYHRLSSSDSSVIEHYKLTRQDSKRPIAYEKVKKKVEHMLSQDESIPPHSKGFMSLLTSYKGIIRQTKGRYYLHPHLVNTSYKQQKGISYGCFLSNDSKTLYDPYYLNYDLSLEDKTNQKEVMNQLFRQLYPEINISFSKINAIKSHLLNIALIMDLELSSLSHAYVYFEKLVQKQAINKENRKLIAACCLFLATKINEPKDLKFGKLLETMQTELNIDSTDVRNNEFAVFADLEFDLYVPQNEFMPHLDKITRDLGKDAAN